MPRTRIAVIEDETDILEVIVYNLKREGYQTVISKRGDDGLQIIQNQFPALVILDLMLPGMSGLDVCRKLKSDPVTSDIPVIIVSAKGEESDIVLGLGLGADDYICKPFSPRELIARVKAVLRRGSLQDVQMSDQVRIQELVIDTVRHEARIDGDLMQLTATEFRMLHQLATQPGRAYTREQLLNRVVGDGVVVVDRNIDVHIRSIRKKLGQHSHLIETIRGIGYRFQDMPVKQ
jgi:DNA-binding response OmpR family regulator